MKISKRVIGLDFGQGFTKISLMESHDRRMAFLVYDLIKTGLKEEKGPELVNFISGFLKAHAPDIKEAHVTLADSDGILIKYLTLPFVPKEEILQAIQWQLKSEVPFSVEDAAWGWQVTRSSSDDEGVRKIEVLCVCAKDEIIRQCLAVAADCRLETVSISLSPLNYAILLAHLEDTSSPLAVLDIGYKDASLSIYRNHKLNFTRSLGFSSHKLTQSLTTALATSQGLIELSYDEAEALKKSSGILEGEAQAMVGRIPAPHWTALLRPFQEGLVREARRSFDYFTSHFKEEKPVRLFVTGGGAGLKNLKEYLSRELAMSVAFLPWPSGVDVLVPNQEDFACVREELTSVMASCLPSPGAINLLPSELKAQKFVFIEKISLRLLAVVISAVCLLSLFFTQFQTHDYRRRLLAARGYLGQIENFRILKEKIDARANLINRLHKDKIPVDGTLKVLSNIMPRVFLLDELVLDEASGTLILKGHISAVGATEGFEPTVLIKQLEASDFFKEVTLIASRLEGNAHIFEISCALAQEPKV